MDRKLQVVYASDDCFAEILGVSLISLYENNKSMEEIHVYVLESKITDKNKKKLECITNAYGRSPIIWVPAKDISKELQMNVSVDRGSLSQYARLFVSSALPDNLDRVLYLDCDIIFNQSLEELWNIDMKGKTIAALKDAFSSLYRTNIGLKSKDIMFNSGVMLIDMNHWKERKVEERLLQFIQKRKGNIPQGDQGALNAILSHDTCCFEPRFNSVTIYYDFSYKELLIYRKPPEFYSEEQIREATENPVIIHFTTSLLSRRPWIEGCQHRYVNVWLKYKAMSPWKDAPLWKYKKAKGIKGVYMALSRKLPRKIMIPLSSILQAYGRPLIYRIKNSILI